MELSEQLGQDETSDGIEQSKLADKSRTKSNKAVLARKGTVRKGDDTIVWKLVKEGSQRGAETI